MQPFPWFEPSSVPREFVASLSDDSWFVVMHIVSLQGRPLHLCVAVRYQPVPDFRWWIPLLNPSWDNP